MKVLDAERGTIETANLFKRHSSPDVHASVSALRSAPQALQKSAPAAAVRELPFKLDDMDEDGTFSASLDETHTGFNYDRSARHFDDHGVVHVAGDKDDDEAKVARITGTVRDKKAKRITIRGRVHNAGARKKIAEGVLTHLSFKVKTAANGGSLPLSARLSDSKHPDESGKLMRLLKRNGRVVRVFPKITGTVPVNPLGKRDPGLDPFRQIFGRPPSRGR